MNFFQLGLGNCFAETGEVENLTRSSADEHSARFSPDGGKLAFLRGQGQLVVTEVEGDRVTLVAPGAGVWRNGRMPEDREELLEALQGLEALYIPDTARDRMSDYEAMRIHNFRDYEVLNRVERLKRVL